MQHRTKVSYNMQGTSQWSPSKMLSEEHNIATLEPGSGIILPP